MRVMILLLWPPSRDRMKLLIIPHSPAFDSRGYFLAKHLAELGDEVHFLIWDPYPRDISSVKKNLSSSLKYVAYIKDGIMVHKIRRLPFFFPPINHYMFRKLISQIFKRQGLDVVISESFFNELEPRFNLPLVYDLVDHHEAYLDTYAGSVERFGLKYILNLKKSVHDQIRHAVAVTAVSDILVDYARNINPTVGVYKVPNGVDSLFLKASLERSKARFGKHSMVYVSYFGKWANLPKLIQATKLLERSYADIKLVLVGDGPSILDAKKRVARMGLSGHVNFLGHVDREELMNIVSECEIALSPCKKDLVRDSAFPIKIIEYTALGKKIVSSNLEEVKLLRFPNIVLYDESKGVEELVNAIITAFNADMSERKIRKLGYKYTWKGIAKEFHNILEGVLVK